MKLNADIIYNGLSRYFQCEMRGPELTELSLGRAEFYFDGDNSFHKDHLYLASVDHLPQRPHTEKGSMLICIGDGFTLNYYKERITLIVIRKKRDIFKVHQILQDIYNQYDEWENAIYRDLAKDGDIQSLISDSASIFGKPIYVLDSAIKIVASTERSNKAWNMTDSGSLNFDSMDKYLSAYDLMFEKRNAMIIELYGIRTLCVNLFNKEGQYEGCLCITSRETDFADGEDKMAEYLASMIEIAIERNHDIINDSQPSLKKVIQALTEEMPLSHSQRMILSGSNGKKEYICICLRYGKGHNQLPLSYISDIFEETFADSYAFSREDSIIGLVNTDTLKDDKNGSYNVQLNKKLGEFVRGMHLCAGISNQFSDLYNVRIHYMQALAAIENGLMMNKENDYFYFSSYALNQMVVNSLGNMPLQAYFPVGLNNLIEQDRTSGVSYLETLKVFLEESMSYTSTAQKLFIHRSTLIDRISRIEKELNVDLNDYDQRLQLELLLKAMDLEETLRQQ